MGGGYPGGGPQGGGFQGGGPQGGRMGRMGGGGGGAPGANAEHTVPYDCHRVCSGFGTHQRCDGSTRAARFPVHDGIDIHVPQGTPLLAIADGDVIGPTHGGSIGGLGLVIHHPPGTVSPTEHVFAVYKHLRAPSSLAKGAHVTRGQVVAMSGKTGTADKHFGPNGFAHLHFETHVSSTAKWPGGKLTSPLGLLKGQGWPVSCRG